MKKIILFLLPALLGLMIACEPIVENIEMGDVVPESELQLEMYQTSEGSNEIVLVNKTPNVGTFWDYITGYSAKERDTIVIPFSGEVPIKFTGSCAGGPVTTTRTVNITNMVMPVPDDFQLFAGTTSKRWELEEQEEQDGGAFGYGSGGAGHTVGALNGWGQIARADIEATIGWSPDDYMEFSLVGGPIFTRYAADGSVIEKGTFKFNMSLKRAGADDWVGNWSNGELYLTGASIPCGTHIDLGLDGEPLYTFYIQDITEDHLWLAAISNESLWGQWSGGVTYWSFVPKE